MKKANVLTYSLLAAGLLSAINASAAVGTLTGPVVHRNLQIFLVHGDTHLESRHYGTLSEALERHLVVAKETGNVNELTIENVSKDLAVFINAGDIVKGGRQDRTVREDLILPPMSGPVPLAAFCVEHGRWTQRGHENAAEFSSNTKILSSRSEKLASRYANQQGEVWAGVAEQQKKLADNLSRITGSSVDVHAPASGSSLQLSLENRTLDSVTRPYMEKFKSLLDGKTDVIGFVYVINGEINSAEVYNNKNLFRALWPKLLDAAVTEAVTECNNDRNYPPLSAEDVKTFFQTAVSGVMSERDVWKSTRVRTYTTASTVLFETKDLNADSNWIHKSFINKGKESVVIEKGGGVVVPLDHDSLR